MRIKTSVGRKSSIEFAYRFLPSLLRDGSFYAVLTVILVVHLVFGHIDAVGIYSLAIFPIYVACALRTFPGANWIQPFLLAYLAACLLDFVDLNAYNILAGIGGVFGAFLAAQPRIRRCNKRHLAEAWKPEPIVLATLVLLMFGTVLYFVHHNRSACWSWIIGFAMGTPLGFFIPIAGGTRLYISKTYSLKVTLRKTQLATSRYLRWVVMDIKGFDYYEHWLIAESHQFDYRCRPTAKYETIMGRRINYGQDLLRVGEYILFASPTQVNGIPAMMQKSTPWIQIKVRFNDVP